MFGNILEQFEQKQAEMQAKLGNITATVELSGIKVVANGNKEIVDLQIPQNMLEDAEQLSDLLVVALNRALNEAAEKAAGETSKMMESMMPPGLGGLSGLFGK